MKFDPRAFFPLQYRSSSSHAILCYWAGLISYALETSIEIETFSKWYSGQDKPVSYTETTEPHTTEQKVFSIEHMIVSFSEKPDLSTQFMMQMQRNQIYDLKEHFEAELYFKV